MSSKSGNRFASGQATKKELEQKKEKTETALRRKEDQYRLIAEIIFPYGRLYVRHVLTHREYDRGKWKNE